MDKLVSEQGFMACGWLCGALGVLGSAVVEWGPFALPGVSSMGVGFSGVTGAICFFGLSCLFRGL